MDKKITAAIFILGVVVGVGGFYFFQTGRNISSQEAGKLAIDFINKAIEQNNVTASLAEISEESGVYKFHLKIAEQEYDSFISKDGRYLFSTAFDLEQNKSEEAAE